MASLAGVPTVNRQREGARSEAVAAGILVAFLAAAPFVLYPVFVMKALCFALFACAFNLLIGYVGLLSFGHALYFGWASYLAAYAAKQHERQFGWKNFRVLTVTTDRQRMRAQRRTGRGIETRACPARTSERPGAIAGAGKRGPVRPVEAVPSRRLHALAGNPIRVLVAVAAIEAAGTVAIFPVRT